MLPDLLVRYLQKLRRVQVVAIVACVCGKATVSLERVVRQLELLLVTVVVLQLLARGPVRWRPWLLLLSGLETVMQNLVEMHVVVDAICDCECAS